MPLKIRPSFTIDTPLTIEEILARLKDHLNTPGAFCGGAILNDYVILHIPEDQEHFWSPRLTISLKPAGEHTRIRGLFGPRPTVWTLFATFYLFAVFLGFVGLMWGGAQWSLGMEPQALWLVGASGVALTSAYGIALIGQKLSEEQMHVLRDFLYQAIEEPVAEAPQAS